MIDLVLGLGGNVGDDAAIVARFDAVADAMMALGAVTRSSLYRTAAVGGPRQADYINAALLVRISDSPPALAPTPASVLLRTRQLEHALGRDRAREVRWGPRVIDIDLLLFGHHTVDLDVGGNPLIVPHPRLLLRRFALEPTIELLGDGFVHPVSRRTLTAALAAALAQPVTRMGTWLPPADRATIVAPAR